MGGEQAEARDERRLVARAVAARKEHRAGRGGEVAPHVRPQLLRQDGQSGNRAITQGHHAIGQSSNHAITPSRHHAVGQSVHQGNNM
eukprot:6307149-Prymnesium_polylepis.1